jgi:hypothetical protein
MNYREIGDLMYEIVGDDRLSQRSLTESMLAVFCGLAIRDLNGHKVVKKRRMIRVIAGTGEYELPSDCQQVIRVTFDYQQLPRSTLDVLDNADANWRASPGTPERYYMENNIVGLYPTPSTSGILSEYDQEFGIVISDADQEFGVIVDRQTNDGLAFDQEYGTLVSSLEGGNLEVFYWSEPDDIGEEIPPDVPLWAHHAVLAGAMAYYYEADTFDVDPEKAAAYRAMFDEMKHTLGSICLAPSGKVHAPRSGPGRRWRTRNWAVTIPEA